MGRFQKPLVIGRVRGGEIEGVSSKELFEQVRDLSLGLVGARDGSRAIGSRSISESRPEWILTDLAVISAGGGHRPDLSDAVGVAGALHLPGLRRPHRGRVDHARSCEKIQEIRHQLPAIEAVILIDHDTAEAQPVGPAVRRRGAARACTAGG